jgi:transposase
MQITTIGLDIAKNLFQVHGVDAQGRPVLKRRLARAKVLEFFANLPPCLVGLEACGAAHHWARELARLGHPVRLMPPQYVRPYVKTNKHDAADAEACCEAVQRPGMRFVPAKREDQQALMMLHRVREQLLKQRTATTNALRAHLAEFGIVAAQRRGRACASCWPWSPIPRTGACRRWRASCSGSWPSTCAASRSAWPSSTAACWRRPAATPRAPGSLPCPGLAR